MHLIKLKNLFTNLPFLIIFLLSLTFISSFGLNVNAQNFNQAKNELRQAKITKVLQKETCEDVKKGNSCTKYVFSVTTDTNTIEAYTLLDQEKKINFKVGDSILVIQIAKDKYDIAGISRQDKYLWVAMAVVIIFLLVFGLKIYKTLLTSLACLGIVYYLIIPNIIKSVELNPDAKFYFTSILICFLILALIIFLNHGFNKKSFISFFASAISMYAVSGFILVIYDFVLRIDAYGINSDSLGNLANSKDFVRVIYYVISLVSITGIMAYLGYRQTSLVFDTHEQNDGQLNKLQLFRKVIDQGFEENQHLIPLITLMNAGFDFFTLMATKTIAGAKTSPDIMINNTDAAFAFGNLMCVLVSIILVIPLSSLFTLIFIRYNKQIQANNPFSSKNKNSLNSKIKIN
jgi:uncharacterized membrane protein